MLARRLRLLAGSLTLSRRLERALPPAAREIMARLGAAGHGALLVGGCVRDLLLGKEPKDWDMVTSAEPPELLRLFPEGRAMGAARGGSTVLVPRGGAPYEVTPYRGEGLMGDLARRDFTINAMALGLDGRLHDPLGGRADLARGLVRACGEPEARLREDPLRLLRAVRFAAGRDFALEPGLAAAVAKLAHLLAAVAPERVGAEFGRILLTDRPAWALERLREFGLLPYVAPELAAMVGVEQNQYHAYPVWEHSLLAMVGVPAELPLRLAALLHDVGKPATLSVDAEGNRHFYRHEQVGAEMADALLERLHFEGEVRRKVVHLVRHHMDLHVTPDVTDAGIRRMVRRIGREHLRDFFHLRRADALATGKVEGNIDTGMFALFQEIERVTAGDAALKVTDLAVDGHDVVQAFGRPPGPYVGEVLERLLDEVLEEPERNSREYLLQRLSALSWYDGKSD